LDIILDASGDGQPDGGNETNVSDLPAKGQELDLQPCVIKAIDEDAVKGQGYGEAYRPLLMEGLSFPFPG
jgi:hypothetical protein